MSAISPPFLPYKHAWVCGCVGVTSLVEMHAVPLAEAMERDADRVRARTMTFISLTGPMPPLKNKGLSTGARYDDDDDYEGDVSLIDACSTFFQTQTQCCFNTISGFTTCCIDTTTQTSGCCFEAASGTAACVGDCTMVGVAMVGATTWCCGAITTTCTGLCNRDPPRDDD